MVSSTTVGVRKNRFKPQLEGSKRGGVVVEQGSKMCVHFTPRFTHRFGLQGSVGAGG